MSSIPKSLGCVRCDGYPLEICQQDGSPVAVCARCGGIWCDAQHWNRDKLGEPPADWVTTAEEENLVPLPTLSCPRCSTELEALRLSAVDGLELDVCRRCDGAWLDKGEWEKLQACEAWQKQLPGLERPTTWGEWFFQMFLRLPVEFNIRPRKRAWMTLSIVAISTVVTLLMMLGPEMDEALMRFSADGSQRWTPYFLLTLITHLFLHAGLLHLLSNMYMLYILGDNVEDVLGRTGFLLFFLACGAAAAIGQVLATAQYGPALPLVGASGAVAGVMAAYLFLFRQSRLTFMFLFWQFKPPAALWILVWLLTQIAAVWLDPSSMLSGVAWWAHIAGFAAGTILILPFRHVLVSRHALLTLLEKHKLHKRFQALDWSAVQEADAAGA